MILENFYLCNNIHTVNKLMDMLDFNFDNIIFVLDDDDNTQVLIDIENNEISVNDITKRIILGDISLSYILS
jgi:hypothetical protein